MVNDSGHALTGQALVNEAGSRLHPSGFDPSCEVEQLLLMADAAVTFALDLGSGYPTPEMDAGIHYAQERGFDRWSMQAQMDAAALAQQENRNEE